MSDIYINGKYYHIVHKKLKENHNFNNKYDYAKNDTHIVYTIEFTKNKVVFDKIGATDFKFEWFDILQYDNINDAIKNFVSLYYNDLVLFIHMFMDVYYNGEIILSECKDNVMYSILDEQSQKRLRNAEAMAHFYQKEYERLRKFVNMYNISDSDIDKRLQNNKKEVK